MSCFVSTDESGFTRYRCPGCGGSSHPATGSQVTANHVWCWRCSRDFARWVHGWTNRKGKRKGPAFYDHVGVVKSR